MTLLLLFYLAHAQAPPVAEPTVPTASVDPSVPGITTSDALAEGAALNLGEAARRLAQTADAIAADGRIGHLSALRSDADELAQRAEQLVRLTTEAVEAPVP